MNNNSNEISAKTKLIDLMNEVQPIIDKNMEKFNSAEINIILKDFKQYLKIDLLRDFESRREGLLKESPFDDILS